jgi:hypothetical protein
MAQPTITFRANKGRALSYGDMDTNLGSYFYSSSVRNGNTLILHYTGSNAVPVSNPDHEVSLVTGIQGGENNHIAVYSGSAGFKTIPGFRFDQNNKLGINVSNTEHYPLTHQVEISGSLRTSMGVFTNSDERYKENITPIGKVEASEIISNIEGVRFNMKGDSQLTTGVIAQQVKEVAPEIVSEDNKGMLSLDYTKIIPILIETVKHQQELIAQMEHRLNNLEQ